MSIYDIMMEDDHSDLYNLFLNPPTVIDSVQDSLFTGSFVQFKDYVCDCRWIFNLVVSIPAENQVRFRCHLKRGGLNYRDVIVYEHVQFTGYFSKDCCSIIKPYALDLMHVFMLFNFRDGGKVRTNGRERQK